MQLLQQLARLIEILSPDDVFLFDLIVCLLRHLRSLAEAHQKRKLRFKTTGFAGNYSAEQHWDILLYTYFERG